MRGANAYPPRSPVDGPHRHLDRVAQAQPAAAAAGDEGDAERVAVDQLAGPRAARQVALEQRAEAHEGPRVDHADDLAGEGRVPALLVQLPLEQEGRADVVGG